MNEMKYCKFCDKKKPIENFCKSGFIRKNICKECQNKKQTLIYRNSKKIKPLQEENKQLKERIDKAIELIFKECCDDNNEKCLFYDLDVAEVYDLLEILKGDSNG